MKGFIIHPRSKAVESNIAAILGTAQGARGCHQFLIGPRSHRFFAGVFAWPMRWSWPFSIHGSGGLEIASMIRSRRAVFRWSTRSRSAW